ncbi:X-ray radiation resistance-associated protein 1 [Sphaerodactylus townsendi]|uniref:X-ray radiation resistance-associated protein 1 n=1 Tax=Sphaerodactylus townsendi TaxID=933632 RepID=UPI0020261671|nr:X-ray radiation resistance-associated protein 1 [Sphaerodactylus townsendi]
MNGEGGKASAPRGRSGNVVSMAPLESRVLVVMATEGEAEMAARGGILFAVVALSVVWNVDCFDPKGGVFFVSGLWNKGWNDAMGTRGIYKLDDGNCHPTNCFPARNLLRPQYEEGDMKLHCVKSPSHLCSVDISNQNFVSESSENTNGENKPELLSCPAQICERRRRVFRQFPVLRELDLSLNGLRNLEVNAGDFPHLEVRSKGTLGAIGLSQILDLSYNNLSPKDIRALGVLPRLKALHLTANGLSSLPLDLAVSDSDDSGCPSFPALEVLLLDDNHLSHLDVFVSLANLRSLKQLNLDQNGIKEVPYLHQGANARFSIHPLSAKSGIREGLRSRKSAEIQRTQDAFSGIGEQADYVAMQNTTDPERTAEVVLQTRSPSPSTPVRFWNQGQNNVPHKVKVARLMPVSEGSRVGVLDLSPVTPPTPETSPSPRAASKISSASSGPEFALPLTELRYLSLANNQIEHEEDLLAVALFPSLAELTFYGNPFTTSRSGDPPLLTSFLEGRLGIKLVRKKISKLEKPRIFIPVKANRKVKSPLPKVQKHAPMLEAPSESAFWELWTETEPDLGVEANLNNSEPLPSIGQRSAEESDSETEVYLSSIFPSQVETSSDHFSESLHEVPTLLADILMASLPPRRSSLSGQSQSGIAAPSAEPGSLTPTQEGTWSGKNAPTRTPSTKWGLPELNVLPSSSGQEANLPGVFLPSELPAAEEHLPQVLQLVSSALGQTASPHSPSEQQTLLAPEPPTGSPTGERDLAESLPPIRRTSVAQDRPETSPPAGSLGSRSSRDQGLNLSENILPGRSPETNLSRLGLPAGPPLEKQDLLYLASLCASPSQQQGLLRTVSRGIWGGVPPTNSPPFEPDQLGPTLDRLQPQTQDLSEPTSLPRSPSEDQDPSQPRCLVATPSAMQDPLRSLPPASSSFQGQVLPEPVPPTRSPAREPDSAEPLLPAGEQLRPEPSPPLAQRDRAFSVPPVILISRESSRSEGEPSIQPSAMQQQPPKSVREIHPLPSARSLVGGVSGGQTLPEKQAGLEFTSLASLSSKDFQLLYQRGTSLSSSDKQSFSDDLIAEHITFFMTQEEAAPDSLEILQEEEMPSKEPSAELKKKRPPVPKRYIGYEELLDGPTDMDFIDPRGMRQNVTALEWALQHPLVYREPRARLDSFQKPYVPLEKKVLRIPVPPVQKTKAQKLEELLLSMRTPTNIVEVPVVCVLRRKKANWREYREALALLKDFRKKYKAAEVASAEGRPVPRKQRIAQRPNSLTGIKVSGTCVTVPPAPDTKADKGL